MIQYTLKFYLKRNIIMIIFRFNLSSSYVSLCELANGSQNIGEINGH